MTGQGADMICQLLKERDKARKERDEARLIIQQVEFLISEAMKRLENENLNAAYASLKAALEWIDGEEGK